MPKVRRLTVDFVGAYLVYDAEMGNLIWRVARGCKKAGEIAGGTESDGYIRIRLNGETYQAHRLVWLLKTGKYPDLEIDHINGNRSDNRFVNLRLATRQQNSRNVHVSKETLSGYRGVYWNQKNKKWMAQVDIGNGKKKFLGLFVDKKEAWRVRRIAEIDLFGQFARAN